MHRKFRRLITIASIVAFILVGLHSLTRAIEVAVNQPYVGPVKPKAELVFNHSVFHKNVQPPCGSIRDLLDKGIAVELVGSVERPGSRLYQMWYYEKDLEARTDVTILIGEACGLAYTSSFDEFITNRVPLDVARELTLQFYTNVLEAQGAERYTQRVLDAFVVEEREAPPNSSISPQREAPLIKIDSIQVWVWAQMGIEIPEGAYELVNIDDAWEYDYDPNAEVN